MSLLLRSLALATTVYSVAGLEFFLNYAASTVIGESGGASFLSSMATESSYASVYSGFSDANCPNFSKIVISPSSPDSTLSPVIYSIKFSVCNGDVQTSGWSATSGGRYYVVFSGNDPDTVDEKKLEFLRFSSQQQSVVFSPINSVDGSVVPKISSLLQSGNDDVYLTYKSASQNSSSVLNLRTNKAISFQEGLHRGITSLASSSTSSSVLVLSQKLDNGEYFVQKASVGTSITISQVTLTQPGTGYVVDGANSNDPSNIAKGAGFFGCGNNRFIVFRSGNDLKLYVLSNDGVESSVIDLGADVLSYNCFLDGKSGLTNFLSLHSGNSLKVRSSDNYNVAKDVTLQPPTNLNNYVYRGVASSYLASVPVIVGDGIRSDVDFLVSSASLLTKCEDGTYGDACQDLCLCQSNNGVCNDGEFGDGLCSSCLGQAFGDQCDQQCLFDCVSPYVCLDGPTGTGACNCTNEFITGADCTRCVPGYYWLSVSENCVVCDRGSFCVGGTSLPTKCPSGTISPQIGADSSSDCITCSATTSPNEAQTDCVPINETPTNSTQNPTQPSIVENNGLSNGAIAAIIIVAAFIVLLAIVLALLVYWRRKEVVASKGGEQSIRNLIGRSSRSVAGESSRNIGLSTRSVASDMGA